MEEKKGSLIKVILIIVIIVLLLTIGGLGWYIYTNRDNNIAQNTADKANITEDINTVDPYSNYKDIEWTRTTSINYPSGDPEYNYYSVWIDNSGILHISDTTKEEITINFLPEKAKYVTNMLPGQQLPEDKLIVLTENNNLYSVGDFYADNESFDGTNSPWRLNSNSIVTKIATNILDIYKDDTNEFIPTISGPDIADGTFVGVYALTTEGQLLSINRDYSEAASIEDSTYVLGLPYEDCNSIKGAIIVNFGLLQVTKEDYIRDDSSIKANYLLDNDGNKMTIKYSFYDLSDDTGTDKAYIITLDNKIYYVINYAGINNYKIELLNNKSVANVSYSNSVITVTYSDNTTDEFKVGQYFNEDYDKYGF